LQALEAYAETPHRFRIEISGWDSAAADQEKTITFSRRAVRGLILRRSSGVGQKVGPNYRWRVEYY
jgi:hypothetical protein